MKCQFNAQNLITPRLGLHLQVSEPFPEQKEVVRPAPNRDFNWSHSSHGSVASFLVRVLQISKDVGSLDGLSVGDSVGDLVGEDVGLSVGDSVGDLVGEDVG